MALMESIIIAFATCPEAKKEDAFLRLNRLKRITLSLRRRRQKPQRP